MTTKPELELIIDNTEEEEEDDLDVDLCHANKNIALNILHDDLSPDDYHFMASVYYLYIEAIDILTHRGFPAVDLMEELTYCIKQADPDASKATEPELTLVDENYEPEEE